MAAGYTPNSTPTIAEGFRSLGKDDHEINAREWIVYDALYEFCKRQVVAKSP